MTISNRVQISPSVIVNAKSLSKVDMCNPSEY